MADQLIEFQTNFKIKKTGILQLLNDIAVFEDIEDRMAAVQLITEELSKLEDIMDSAIQASQAITSKLRELEEENGKYKDLMKELHEEMDRIRKSMTDRDKDIAVNACTKRYGSLWDTLNSSSKEFLYTAKYLLNKLKDMEGDFAPVVIEMCRTVENELKSKIFNGFISDVAYDSSCKSDDSPISGAVKSYKESSEFFISLKQMHIELGNMNPRKSNTYSSRLYDYTSTVGWNSDQLASKELKDSGINFVDTFRNDSAHTKAFSEKEAMKCEEQTYKRIRAFMACRRNRD